MSTPAPRTNVIDESMRLALRVVVTFARSHITTERDHALYPNHRADERLRDVLEEVLAEPALNPPQE